MSSNKLIRQLNRSHAYRVIRKQTKIFCMYNDRKWLAVQKPHSFAKRKSMNCGCMTCRAWAKSGREANFKRELEKAGMSTKYAVKPGTYQREEEWV